MAKMKSSRVVKLVDKLAVESEPGLTNAQLMLHNHDLKPGKIYYKCTRMKLLIQSQLNLPDDNGERELIVCLAANTLN